MKGGHYRVMETADWVEYLQINLRTAVIVTQRKIDALFEQLAWDWYRGRL